MTMTIERHVDVHAQAGDAYANWWRSFESGDISDDVEVVEPTGPQRYRWRASVAGVGEEWIAEVTERIPGRRIAWTSRAGAPNAGCVTFHRLDDERTRVMLQLEYKPEGVIEKLGAWLGVVDRRVDSALNDFKIHLETERVIGDQQDADEPGAPPKQGDQGDLQPRAATAVSPPPVNRTGRPASAARHQRVDPR